MNTQAKPELFAPCFPIFWIKGDSIEVDADKVSFTLKYGCVEIDCEAQADDVDVDYTKLEIDQNTPISVLRHDVNLTEGQKLQLTAQQVEKLNQQLEWICIELFEKKLEKVA